MTDDLPMLQIVRNFVSQSSALNGQEVREREPWHTEVTADAVRHHAYGISDDNPLWVNSEYAQAGPFGQLVAPPSFLCSVLYPALHGAPVSVPLSSLIVELGYDWFEPVRVGDRIQAAARQVDAIESRDREGRPLALIVSTVKYWNQHGRLVAEAHATVARAAQESDLLLVDREVYRYPAGNLQAIKDAQCREHRSGRSSPTASQLAVGDQLPELVRGPLTIGDLVCWQAAVGPAYRPGSLGYQDTVNSPHTTVVHPVTGWPVKSSQQHEDFLLSTQRGMPVPFDNGVMRLAWVSPLLTNWIGDHGTLLRLSVELRAPNLYGDTTWYRGRIAAVVENGQDSEVTVDLTGENQLGEATMTGQATVRLPGQPSGRTRLRSDTVSLSQDGRSRDDGMTSVLERLDRQVRQTPDAFAVADGTHQWTYRELHDRSDAIAARLMTRGVTRGDAVAICLARSSAWIPAMVGVLKAGGILLPLDPSYPRPRLDAMMMEAQPQLAIASLDSRRLLGLRDDQVLDPVAATGDGEAGEPTTLRTERRDLAYIVFTSGSTGVPRGVTVAHGVLNDYVAVMRQALRVGPADVCLHTAAFSFSASIRQAFVPLCAGATLVVASEAERRDPLALAALMRTHSVTVWDTVPSVWRLVLESWSASASTRDPEIASGHLRLVALTGEALTWDLPNIWRERFGEAATISNLYSHSETAGMVAMFSLSGNESPSHEPVPLGWPVGGSRLYLLDDDRTPCRPGAVGDVWVGGDRLAEGYLHQPTLTRERFVEDPFLETTGARMFRTGDRGRERDDGAIEFCGRADQWVNVRGHRIEPGDVESTLRQHPGVREVVVSPRTDPSGDTRLVGYVVPHSIASPVIDGAQRYRLPNNLALVHLNQHETDFIYRATFEDQTYLKHGVTLRDGDCIFDVGANIGQFSLFAHLVARQPRLFAFEPNPRARAALAANLQLYDTDCRVFAFGLGDAKGNACFTAFDGFSLLSGLHVDVEEEKALVRAFMSNEMSDGEVPNDSDEEVQQILDERFAARTFDIPIRTLSSVIDEERVDRIDLLKINVEKAEFDVLRGIRPEHWPRIGQVVIKVDRPETIGNIVSLLESHGLECAIDQDAVMTGTRVRTVYAVRPANGRRLVRDQAPGAHRRVLPELIDPLLTPTLLREFLLARLPEHMVPAFVILIPSLPLSPQGKVDRLSLPEPDWSQPDVGESYQAPGTLAERQLVGIWANVLGIERVGVHDNFLELGGDSVAAVRILNRVRTELKTNIQLAAIFSHPTVAGLAREISKDSFD